jgi:hypothetical protein
MPGSLLRGHVFDIENIRAPSINEGGVSKVPTSRRELMKEFASCNSPVIKAKGRTRFRTPFGHRQGHVSHPPASLTVRKGGDATLASRSIQVFDETAKLGVVALQRIEKVQTRAEIQVFFKRWKQHCNGQEPGHFGHGVDPIDGKYFWDCVGKYVFFRNAHTWF